MKGDEPTLPQYVASSLGQFPPELRRDILQNERFAERAGLKMERLVSIGDFGHFDSESFEAAVRKAYTSKQSTVLSDTKGKEWRLEFQNKGSRRVLALCNADNKLILPDFRAVCDNPADRREYIADLEATWPATHGGVAPLIGQLKDGPLGFDEAEVLENWREKSPPNFIEKIQNKIRTGMNFADLIVTDEVYIEMLIGSAAHEPGGISERNQRFVEFFESLSSWSKLEGFEHALRLASSPGLVECIPVSEFNRDAVVSALGRMPGAKSLFETVALCEYTILHFIDDIEICLILKGHLTYFIQEILSSRRIDLFSKLFTVIDCMHIESGAFKYLAPSLRRQTSIAQTCLVERAIIDNSKDIESFIEWLNHASTHNFHLQNFIDLVREPRWISIYASPDQFRAEFSGRLMNRIRQNSLPDDHPLMDCFFGDENTIESLVVAPQSYFPGPLEGEPVRGQKLPDEIESIISNELGKENLSVEAFVPLINSTALASIADEHGAIAARALKRVNHQLDSIDAERDVVPYVIGLAHVSAAAKSVELADELRVLSRVLRRTRAPGWNSEVEFKVLLTSAAAEANLSLWAVRVGEWLRELAYEITLPEEARRIRSILRALWRLAPEIRRHTCLADAILEAAEAGRDRTPT
jgi:hypothetical protein